MNVTVDEWLADSEEYGYDPVLVWLSINLLLEKR